MLRESLPHFLADVSVLTIFARTDACNINNGIDFRLGGEIVVVSLIGVCFIRQIEIIRFKRL